MAKIKKLTTYEMALDAIRSPVRKVDEAIQLWDRLSMLGPSMKGFNAGTRIYSVVGEFADINDARRLAQTIMDGYAGRFVSCVIRRTPCCFTGKPLYTKFIFTERADRGAPGIYVEI